VLLRLGEEEILKRIQRAWLAVEVLLEVRRAGDEVDAGVVEAMERGVRPVDHGSRGSLGRRDHASFLRFVECVGVAAALKAAAGAAALLD
jgi:hypothetical protein